jgi:hypothetical protein
VRGRLRAGLCAGIVFLAGCRGRPAAVPKVPAAPAGRTIVLAVFDTTRLDEFGAYGSRDGVTPFIDLLAGRGLVYEAAFATDSFTMPSHAAMFSGRLTGTESRLPSDGSLVPSLRAAGFRTVGVSANWVLDPATGFDQGFEVFTNVVDTETRAALENGRENAERRRECATGAAVVATIRDLLVTVKPEDSLFLFANFFDPHDPYTPHVTALNRFASRVSVSGHLRSPDGSLTAFFKSAPKLGSQQRRDLRRLYRAEVFQADAAFGALRDLMRRLGRDDDALYVVTADHGELLGERGQWTHNIGLSEPEVHVPLVVAGPGIPRESRREAVSLAGLRDAVERWNRTGSWEIAAQPPLLFHRTYPGNEVGLDPLVATDEIGLVEGDRRISRSAAGCRLFEREKPYWREMPCQVASGPGARMTARLNDAFRSRVGGPRLQTWTHDAPSAEWLRRLRSLGYLAH